MNKSFLEMLACPMDKHHPLELHGDGGADPIIRGVLYCTKCGRFYMISEGIPVMLPDDLRNRASELDHLRGLPDLPEKVTLRGRPWNLSA